MPAKPTRRPSALFLQSLLGKEKAETQELKAQVKELQSLAKLRDGYVTDIEGRLHNSIARIKVLEGRLRVADLDNRNKDATIESLARHLGELEGYKNARERADARDAYRPMADTDNGADLVGAAA